MTAQLKTERLHLRPVALADARAIARFTAEPEIARVIAAMPDPNPLIATEGFILIAMARSELRRDFNFAIDLEGTGLVGMARANPLLTGVDIGYWIGKPFWGRGYATEAVCAVSDFAARLGAGPVTSAHFADDPASGRVLEKSGFFYTGEMQSIYALARRQRALTRLMTRRSHTRAQAA